MLVKFRGYKLLDVNATGKHSGSYLRYRSVSRGLVVIAVGV